ncbi:fused (3R)-hydroxyacyl-ACP dehydratase subunits HadA/HadB [Nocardia panacis]|uniref:fused (3R)-hydroxyacyl-ACP dehydratase subunits HadA/HadB n=1 Tax=Nocardia panacis TaxID=2340916 RepID=UPI001EF08FAD|nr:fused (3R)-hydroxyacyl-ACP dehydratase subunits HadA/HadB [Nocardia panacis]
MAEPESERLVRTATLAGRRFRVLDHYEVGREKVREFARAVQSYHGAHHSEEQARTLGYPSLIAPPTFASVIGLTTTRALLDTVLTEYDLSQILQTDQVFETFRPLVAGDRITTDIIIESIRQYGDNDFITVKSVLTNQRDEVALIGQTTIVARRGAEIDPDLTELVSSIMMHTPPNKPAGQPDSEVLREFGDTTMDLVVDSAAAPVHTLPRFGDLVVGQELPAATAQVTRGDLANYSGVSGDPNPIHYSEAAARLVGLPTVVGHGMLSMGLAGDYLTSWLGDPTAIEKFSVRLSSFVAVTKDKASVIEFTGRIKSLDPVRRTATVVLNGTSEGRKIFGRAVAEVRLT